jgi:hypothetical protein
MRSLPFVVLASLAVLLGTTGPAAAYCRKTTCDPGKGDKCEKNDRGCVRDGVALRWSTSPIVYRFYEGGSKKLDKVESRKKIRKAFESWSNVQCADGRTSLRFEEGSDISDDKPLDADRADEAFGIYFRDKKWPHDDANESIALTNQIYGKDTGKIYYADMEINTAEFEFALSDEDRDGTTDLEAVVTHEVGHYIGLDHSTDPDSIMVPRYCQAKTDRCKGGIDRARDLAQDDELAVCVAYPPPDSSTAPPVQGCSTTRTSHPGELGMLLGFCFVGIACVRRRTRA